MGQKRTIRDLAQMQSLPLSSKILMTKQRIVQWYEHWHGNVFVSVSGKDSRCVLHIARSIYPDMKAVFVDTGLEYPEVKELAYKDPNCEIIRPKKPFWQVVRDEGYPVISKEVSEVVNNSRKYLASKMRGAKLLPTL